MSCLSGRILPLRSHICDRLRRDGDRGCLSGLNQRAQYIPLRACNLIDQFHLTFEIRVVGAQLDTIDGLEQMEGVAFRDPKAREDFLREDDSQRVADGGDANGGHCRIITGVIT